LKNSKKKVVFTNLDHLVKGKDGGYWTTVTILILQGRNEIEARYEFESSKIP